MGNAVVLLGHGSRDPIWCQPMQAMAKAIVHAQPELPVVCAYLELCEPTAEHAIGELVQRNPGLRTIVVYPVFLGMGLHLREDLPQLAQTLQQQFPQIQVHFTPALGMDEQLIQLVAASVLKTCATLR